MRHFTSKSIKNKTVITYNLSIYKFVWISKDDDKIIFWTIRKLSSFQMLSRLPVVSESDNCTTPVGHASPKYTEDSYSNDTIIGISRTTHVLLFWPNRIYKLVLVMINIASDWREKRSSSTGIGIWKPLGTTRQFPVGFFWHTPPQPALLLYRNLHASLKVTPVYWPFDLDVFFSIIIIIMIYFLVVIRFLVNPEIVRCFGREEGLGFFYSKIKIYQ